MSGDIPFGKLSHVARVQAICAEEENPPKQPESSNTGISYAVLWTVAERCWQKSPGNRPSMNEARDLIAPAEACSTGEDDLDGLVLLSMPRGSGVAVKRDEVRPLFFFPLTFRHEVRSIGA